MKHLVRKTTTNNFEAFGKARWSSWIPSVLFNLCKITTDWITIVVKDPEKNKETVSFKDLLWLHEQENSGVCTRLRMKILLVKLLKWRKLKNKCNNLLNTRNVRKGCY
ncbi:uncharacterized protein LOC107012444 isoform X2 [Solanum pennellii]|uniref:Uncharacterized protein LOC107008777 isoform X2 n=1 Tax=Solanum pennellii TaxID=28526 RepID=A0ABM1FYK1_SOLPN|nr:uncharacterized protein LOC107008777 isoform X2 [Solanum pennellii]XP_015067780.1 uncharacterized protein LOC107012444 isoform X2 [Solanum pennellii]